MSNASPSRDPNSLRSHRWLGPDDLRSFGHRSRMKQMGFGPEDYAGKPVIGILNTWSDLNTCHTHFPQRVEEVKRGVLQAGGFPVEIPVMSLCETFMKPSAMFYRNLLAMETEEMLRCHPIDGAVLMGGCDKTTPGLIMGAISMDLPVIFFPPGRCSGGWTASRWAAGPMRGSLGRAARGESQRMPVAANRRRHRPLARPLHDDGHGRTMTAIAETLGMTLSGASSIPAVHSAHSRMAAATGRRIVEMVWEDLKPSEILTRESFDNAIAVDMAIGGSTNAIIHLDRDGGRAGVALPLDRFDEISQRTPVIANLRPSGEFLMEDFYDAGGLRALLNGCRSCCRSIA